MIGPRDNVFPGPAVALDGPAVTSPESPEVLPSKYSYSFDFSGCRLKQAEQPAELDLALPILQAGVSRLPLWM